MTELTKDDDLTAGQRAFDAWSQTILGDPVRRARYEHLLTEKEVALQHAEAQSRQDNSRRCRSASSVP